MLAPITKQWLLWCTKYDVSYVMSCYHHFSAHFQHLLNQGVPMPVHIGAQIPFLIVTYAAIGKYAWQYILTCILLSETCTCALFFTIKPSFTKHP